MLSVDINLDILVLAGLGVIGNVVLLFTATRGLYTI